MTAPSMSKSGEVTRGAGPADGEGRALQAESLGNDGWNVGIDALDAGERFNKLRFLQELEAVFENVAGIEVVAGHQHARAEGVGVDAIEPGVEVGLDGGEHGGLAGKRPGFEQFPHRLELGLADPVLEAEERCHAIVIAQVSADLAFDVCHIERFPADYPRFTLDQIFVKILKVVPQGVDGIDTGNDDSAFFHYKLNSVDFSGRFSSLFFQAGRPSISGDRKPGEDGRRRAVGDTRARLRPPSGSG
jgi:hypothetical protein